MTNNTICVFLRIAICVYVCNTCIHTIIIIYIYTPLQNNVYINPNNSYFQWETSLPKPVVFLLWSQGDLPVRFTVPFINQSETVFIFLDVSLSIVIYQNICIYVCTTFVWMDACMYARIYIGMYVHRGILE